MREVPGSKKPDLGVEITIVPDLPKFLPFETKKCTQLTPLSVFKKAENAALESLNFVTGPKMEHERYSREDLVN